MKDVVTKVKEFHLKFGQAVEDKPVIPPEEERQFRYALLEEELREFCKAEQDDDLVEIADALGDLIYIIVGHALRYGIPLDRVFDEIHASNMTKERNPKKKKIQKGAAFKPPKIKEILGL